MLKYEISNKIFQLSFKRLNDNFFQVILSRKSTFCTETLQSLQRLSPGFHCLVTFLTFFSNSRDVCGSNIIVPIHNVKLNVKDAR